jgi:predicted ArsR family transcriptional regulator
MTIITTSTRTEILRAIKQGVTTQSDLADSLGITREAVRQHLAALESQGVIQHEQMPTTGRGRPIQGYRVTEQGEHQFPKFYDALSLSLIQAVAEHQGADGLKTVLQAITDQQVEAWQSRTSGKSLIEKMRALRDIYFDKDPYTSVERDDDGAMLIEHNCPYLAVATAEPRLCSVTVSTLQRLLGVEVSRTKRFQAGDGRCVFRIHEDKPTSSRFRFKWEE